MSKWLAVLSFLVGLLIFGCIGTKQFPIKGIGLARCETNQPYIENVSYTDVEYYTGLVPYRAQEQYNDTECTPINYTTHECSQQPLNYSITKQNCWYDIAQYTPPEFTVTSFCTINNSDSEDGDFAVYVGFISGIGEAGENQTRHIPSQQSKRFLYTTNTTFGETAVDNADTPVQIECVCTPQSIPTKEVCGDVVKTREDCRNVTKTRNVIKHRNETISRNVTKYRLETMYKTVEEVC